MGKIQPDKRKWRKLTKGEKAIVSKPALAKIIRQQAADIKALHDGLEFYGEHAVNCSLEPCDCGLEDILATTDPNRKMEEV